MTRFATLWVQDGHVVGPVAPMRFDYSIFSMFGEALEDLGDQAVVVPATDTYESFVAPASPPPQARCSSVCSSRFSQRVP